MQRFKQNQCKRIKMEIVDVTTEMLDLMKANQLYGISINAINTICN